MTSWHHNWVSGGLWRQIWCRSLSKSVFFCRFVYFCSAIFVPLFLFRWGLFALKPHLPHYLIDNFCSADLFALALTNFCSAIFVPLFLFCYFCSGAFLHLNPIYHITWLIFVLLTFLHLHLPIFVPLFLFRWGLFLFYYFCSAIFVLLTFLHLHLPIFVPLFLFCYFCSTIFVPLGPFCT